MKSLDLKPLNINIEKVAIALALICAPIISWPAINEFDKIALFGFFLLPFILRIDKNQLGSYRYVIFSLVFALLFIAFQESYWALACGISMVFAAIELRLGKLNEMAFYSLLFYLPITRSFFTLFGFYIRLEITKWAAKLISVFNSDVTFEGTQILHGGQQFSVDAGCMGLRLVITGFLLTLLILNQTSLSYKIKLRTRVVSLFLSLSFFLIILANFFRIVFLIIFQSAEGTVSHELIGIAALIVFHLIPMVFLIRFVLKKNWVIRESTAAAQAKYGTIVNFSLISVSIIMTFQFFTGSKSHFEDDLKYSFNGYAASKSIDGVVTYSSGNSLFSIKPMDPLSFSNHHPMICWRGDGFEISNEARSRIGEYDCMRAKLKSSSEHSLSTVWWYSNNSDCATTSELKWRFLALFKQEKFYILNFTSANEDELIFTINKITQELKKKRNREV